MSRKNSIALISPRARVTELLVPACGESPHVTQYTRLSKLRHPITCTINGFAWVSSTSSVWATNSPSALGGITQYSILRFVMPFF
jgi:hypothetical protein